MLRDRKPKTHNSAQDTQLLINLLASKWTILVLYSLQHGTKRYSEIVKEVDRITEKVLTDTLKKLERDGMVERSMYPVIPPKVVSGWQHGAQAFLYNTNIIPVYFLTDKA